MKRCHKCGEEWTRPGQPGFKETCPKCMSYLHACVNCKLYNPTADRCSSVTAECTGDREGLNYCEEFQFRDQPNNANRRNGNARTSSGNGQKTLGLDPKGSREDAPPRNSKARKKFDKLFNE